MNEEIDWNEAPDDATHCFVGDRFGGHWFKVAGEVLYKFSYKTGAWFKSSFHVSDLEGGEFISRPTVNQQLTVQPEWDGQGLPPVGTVCELVLIGGRVIIVEITAIGKKTVLFIEVGDEVERQEYIHGNFYPITKSPVELLRQLVLAYNEAETKRDLEPMIQRVERFLQESNDLG